MECRLSSSTNRWTCQISIRREYDASGNLLDKVSETSFGHVIIDKNNVELALRRAQVAVLNPDLDPSDILRASADDLTKVPFVSSQSLAFSRDIICVDLEGPELTDLAFIDLPGLIQNAEPRTIKLVEDMVVSHIKGNCLILVALPMTDDIENQKALRLARQEDPDGRRTIGVMTKPDMLTAGSTKARDIWLDIIEGRRHPLVHGYYCTRQPDDAQRAAEITPSEPREAEANFFSSTHPWSTSAHKERFGTVHLVATLSRLLVGIINDTLPRILAEAASKLETCSRELATLPEELKGDPATHMLKLLTTFCDDIQRSTSTGSDASQLIHRNRDAYASFKSAIRKTAPNFVPAVLYNLDKNPSGQHEEAAETSFGVDGLTKAKPFFLNNMRDHIKQSVTRELPNNVPFSAKADLIVQFQEGWHAAIAVCFTAVRQQVEAMLEQRVKDTFYSYDHLEGHIRIFIAEIVQKHFDACSSILLPIHKFETTPYTQNTHYLAESHAKWLGIYKEARSGSRSSQPAHKKRKVDQGQSQAIRASQGKAPSLAPTGFASGSKGFSRKRPATDDEHPEGESERDLQIKEALAALSALGYHGVKPEDLGRLVPPDEYETELQMMAEVRGYFQIAYKKAWLSLQRIIDNVPSMIDYMFVKAVAEDMQSFLISKFALGTADATERCSAFLADNPMVVIKRKELSARKDRLEVVKHALHTFGLS
ncbi:hypothetical protein DXG03_007994 [Asterophora parasitica]|uniref:GED domain-containing protein n=1 Tax=Asterophora parasitica TaxID=117018 RepID=A0A9P7KA80_9AGAR|nr:hypothetical protein DXG03_007994 [Asterophora parasitica]